MRLLGLVLVVLGILAMVYGGFWYTTEEEAAKLGPIEVKVEKKKRVNVPLWAGVASTVVGGLLVLTARRDD
jgi:hypothetical protein